MKFSFNFLLLLTLLWSCNVITNQGVKNSAVVEVMNGMDKIDTVRYTCDSCDIYIKSQDILNKIIDQATEKAKASLNNPLSFIPHSIKMTVEPRDSFYYYFSNKPIDSCIMIKIDYDCIGKNAYGTESKVSSSNLIFLIGDKIQDDFLEIVRLKPLFIDDGFLSRDLTLYDIDGDGNFTIMPTLKKPNSLIIKSSISCIDKGATLAIIFEDKSELRLRNWKDFNCDGTAYFNLSAESLGNLKTKKVKHISFNSDKQQFARLLPNESDYFMQYVTLLEN